MFPPGHLALGYVLTSLAGRWTGRAPTPAAVMAVAVGTQVPDLIDKPLAWHVGVLPTGRTLGHSLFLLVPLAALAYGLARSRGRDGVGLAFGLGVLSHAIVDAAPAVWRDAEADFLLWPVVPVAPYEEPVSTSILERLYAAYVTNPPLGSPYFLAEFVLLAAALWLWYGDGTPGLRTAA